MVKAAEERKAMIAAANAKKKQQSKKGAKKPDKNENVEEEEVKQEAVKPINDVKKELDLTNPDEFRTALQERAPRPFTFGPIEFVGLNNTDE